MEYSSNIKRIAYLSELVQKYAHCWNENPSARMMGWVDELGDRINDAKRNNRAEWIAYCHEADLDPSFNQYDCLA